MMSVHHAISPDAFLVNLRQSNLLGPEQLTAAEEQGRWIDAHAAEDRLSSSNARVRGNEGIYASLARQAHVILLGLKVSEEVGEVGRGGG